MLVGFAKLSVDEPRGLRRGLRRKFSIRSRRGESVTVHATGRRVTKVRNFHRDAARSAVLLPSSDSRRWRPGPPRLPSGTPSTLTAGTRRRHSVFPGTTAQVPARRPTTMGGSSNKRVKLSTKNMLSGEWAPENRQPDIVLGHLTRFGTPSSELPLQSIYVDGAALFIQCPVDGSWAAYGNHAVFVTKPRLSVLRYLHCMCTHRSCYIFAVSTQ